MGEQSDEFLKTVDFLSGKKNKDVIDKYLNGEFSSKDPTGNITMVLPEELEDDSDCPVGFTEYKETFRFRSIFKQENVDILDKYNRLYKATIELDVKYPSSKDLNYYFDQGVKDMVLAIGRYSKNGTVTPIIVNESPYNPVGLAYIVGVRSAGFERLSENPTAVWKILEESK